jgi:hypothetical protein
MSAGSKREPGKTIRPRGSRHMVQTAAWIIGPVQPRSFGLFVAREMPQAASDHPRTEKVAEKEIEFVFVEASSSQVIHFRHQSCEGTLRWGLV